MRQVHNRASTRAGGSKNLEGKAHPVILEQLVEEGAFRSQEQQTGTHPAPEQAKRVEGNCISPHPVSHLNSEQCEREGWYPSFGASRIGTSQTSAFRQQLIHIRLNIVLANHAYVGCGDFSGLIDQIGSGECF
jgi:hypothetical protein